MNILYCGDSYIEKGMLISVISLTKHIKEPLCIYVMTLHLLTEEKEYHPVSNEVISWLDRYVKNICPKSFVIKIDAEKEFTADLPEANMKTRFTPFCMLRLYADLIPELPDKILYLDNDVIFRQNCSSFYHQNISEYEICGILDYYGKWFFRKNLFHKDYINSGVLLMNLKKMKETGLLEKARHCCRTEKMFMPDQSALNKLSVAKKISSRRYNEQRKLRADTVIQHFTTSFRFFPWFHAVSVKPWQIDRMHSILKLHEYDDILSEYQKASATLL